MKLFHAARHPVAIKDSRGIFLGVNRRFERATGRRSKRVEGKHVEELIGGCIAAESARWDMRLLLTREAFTMPGVLVSLEGCVTPCRTLRVPWTLKRGEVGVGLVMLPLDDGAWG